MAFFDCLRQGLDACVANVVPAHVELPQAAVLLKHTRQALATLVCYGIVLKVDGFDRGVALQ